MCGYLGDAEIMGRLFEPDGSLPLLYKLGEHFFNVFLHLQTNTPAEYELFITRSIRVRDFSRTLALKALCGLACLVFGASYVLGCGHDEVDLFPPAACRARLLPQRDGGPRAAGTAGRAATRHSQSVDQLYLARQPHLYIFTLLIFE